MGNTEMGEGRRAEKGEEVRKRGESLGLDTPSCARMLTCSQGACAASPLCVWVLVCTRQGSHPRDTCVHGAEERSRKPRKGKLSGWGKREAHCCVSLGKFLNFSGPASVDTYYELYR